MAEWLVEEGIGETRAVLVEGGHIVEARIELDDSVPAGAVLAARLTDAGRDGRNAIAQDDEQREYLLPHAPRGVAQGAAIAIEVTRAAFPGAEPWKRPVARVTDTPSAPVPPLWERLGGRLVTFPAPDDALEEAGWSDVLEEARSGVVAFAGGSLGLFPTPAMTLIDVDGTLSLEALALAGAKAAAAAIRRLGIGGSIGIDLPTVRGKAARQAAAEAIDAVLPAPFERTAMNGFGFIQIVRPRTGPSLLELAGDRARFEARALVRRAARATGGVRLVAHPSVIARITAEWTERLGRQIGGAVALRADPALAMSGGYAEPR